MNTLFFFTWEIEQIHKNEKSLDRKHSYYERILFLKNNQQIVIFLMVLKQEEVLRFL